MGQQVTKILFVALLVLIANGAYLYAFDSPTLVYISNLLLHVGLGTAAVLAGLFFWRNTWGSFSRFGRIALLLLLASGLLGIFLIWTGTSWPYQDYRTFHILSAYIGVLTLLVALLRQGRGWQTLATVTALSIMFPIGVRVWDSLYPDTSMRIANPLQVPTEMEEEGAGPESPFFPSSSNTNVGHTIPSTFFMEPESCAGSGCHPDIYRQWNSSAHHFSSFNNQWYRKSIEYMQDVIGTRSSKWCGGCHDHAVFFNGMMDRPIKEQLDRPEAHAGLTCTSCHSIVAVGSSMGNGHFVIEYPPLHDLATSKNHFVRAVHDFVVRLDPGPHKNTFMKPFFREQTAEYCSTCHKVHLDIPVNNYRWIRGFNDYDSWQASGVSGQGARSFYYPETPKNCTDCHMPLVESDDAGNIDGLVHSHRFPAANTALPFVNGDEEQLRAVTEFLQDDQVGVDIFALSEVSTADGDEKHLVSSGAEPQTASTFAEGDELGFAVGRATGYTSLRQIVAPLDRVKPTVRRGETIRIDVVVRTKKVGHFFPGGTVDAFDVWVELKAEDENGRLIFWSGHVPKEENGRKGPVDAGAHFYRAFLLDEKGNPINKRNAWAARSVLYVRLIPPGAADTVHFRLQIPEDCGERIFLTAKVNYRKFSWWNTQWAFAGIRDPEDPNPDVGKGYDGGKWLFAGDTSEVSGKLKEIPDLPITTMAQAQTELKVLPADGERPKQESVLHSDDLFRWNDYGIGLLLQGDLKAAEEIFQRVTRIDPSYADGWVNVGRVRVREGRTEEAQDVLLKALEVDPELAKTHFFLALTYKSQGEYDKALQHLGQAREEYPRDRVVLNQIGRILFLRRQYQEAVDVLHEVLRIDPEDLQAHYNLMLAYRGLGNREMALREQKLYLRFKADESSQAITGPYRRANPQDNNERQAIHEHDSYPLEQIRWRPSGERYVGAASRGMSAQ